LSTITLKKNEERRILNGHAWVFSNEIEKKEAASGELTRVYDYKHNLLGYGFFNEHSLISLRLLSASFKGDFNTYIKETLAKAFELRKTFYPQRNSYRFIFSESDFLPGLIIDKYNNTYVLQIYCLGIQQRIDTVNNILKIEYKAENIFTLNDPHFRQLEGLSGDDTIYSGSIKEEIIDDGKIKYKIDFTHSQKTGFYFDQCDNREYIEKLCSSKNVLDVFCNCGGFGLHAAYAKAKSVTFVDSSQTALDNAGMNFKLNGFKIPADFICSDAFDFLEEQKKSGSIYDIVILDPPSFAKSKKHFQKALKGYEKLNKLALYLISEGGFFVTSSCSGYVSREDFYKVITEAGKKAGRKLQLIHFAGASHDHPVIPAMPETSYLKFAVFRVI
jgi:23S rRNA (cytosine1962-C5)-methyltransferase